jgi:hypothetical protein
MWDSGTAVWGGELLFNTQVFPTKNQKWVIDDRAARRSPRALLPLIKRCDYEPYFWKSHSRLQRGQTWRFLSQRLEGSACETAGRAD